MSTRPRRRRGSLSTQEIVDAAMRLLDREGEAALTFVQLGQELGAAPTAVYRHFTNRKELVRALTEHLFALTVEGLEFTDDWRADLEMLAENIWRVAEEHPAASGIALSNVTSGPNELIGVNTVLRAMHNAGLRGRDAVVQYQAYANLVIVQAARHGSRLAVRLHDPDAPEWKQVYTPTDPSVVPYAMSLLSELQLIDYKQVYETNVKMYLDSLASLAAGKRSGDAL